MPAALGPFSIDIDIESMRNIPKGSQRTSFVSVRAMGSDMTVEATVRPESLVVVIGVCTPGDSIAEEYGVRWEMWFVSNSPRSAILGGVNEIVGVW